MNYLTKKQKHTLLSDELFDKKTKAYITLMNYLTKNKNIYYSDELFDKKQQHTLLSEELFEKKTKTYITL